MAWRLGDRVEQPTYGAGTIIELTDQHVVVHFDTHGRRKFSAQLAVLKASEQPDPHSTSRSHSMAPRARSHAQRRTTDPGYENENRQTVVHATNTPGNIPEQRVFVLRCGRCGTHYGANERDIDLRMCPHCMDGPPGLTF
jgi:hypothetical protein